MSRVYEWHMNGDCNDQCPVCEWDDLNEPDDDEEADE